MEQIPPGRLAALDACASQQGGQFLATALRLLGDRAAAQDAVQDAMASAVRSLHRFRGDSQLSTWLGRIVINAALSRRRAIRRRPEESLDALLERDQDHGPRRRQATFASAEPPPDRALLRRELMARVRAAIERLPREYRKVVIMRHYEEHRVAEIAIRLQITQNAVKLRLLRAHRALRRQLREHRCLLATR